MSNNEQLEFNLMASRLIGEIQQLAVLINLNTEMVCEARYAPHTNQFSFVISPNEEVFSNRNATYNLDKSITSSFYLDGRWSETKEKKETIIKKLLKIKRHMVQALKTKGVDFRSPDLTQQQVTYYQWVI